MEKKVFRTRVSVLLIAIIILLCGVLPTFAMMFRLGQFNVSAGLAILGVFVFILFLMYGIRYELTDSHLRIKIWSITYVKIPLSAILSVKRSYNPLSAPAFSMKRLCIRTVKGYKWPYALISPVREKEFLELLLAANPDIIVCVNDKKAWYRIWDLDI